MTTPAMKTIFKHVWDVVGGEPKVTQHVRDEGPEEIDILSVPDQPSAGMTAYATIGMYTGETGTVVEDKPLRVELVSMCDSSVSDYGDMLASCAFNVLRGDYGIRPSTIYPDVVSQYRSDVTMAHMMFVPVFAWEPPPENLSVDGVVVTWLQAVPVSQSEYHYARSNGADALESLLEEADVDVADINRPAVV